MKINIIYKSKNKIIFVTKVNSIIYKLLEYFLLRFCKSAVVCVICTKQGSSSANHIPIRFSGAFPQVTDCILQPMIQLCLYHAVSCQPLARYIMKSHFHSSIYRVGDYRFRVDTLIPFGTLFILNALLSHPFGTISGLRLPPIFDNLGYNQGSYQQLMINCRKHPIC